MHLVTVKNGTCDRNELEKCSDLLSVRAQKAMDFGICQLYEEIRDSPKEFCIIEKS